MLDRPRSTQKKKITVPSHILTEGSASVLSRLSPQAGDHAFPWGHALPPGFALCKKETLSVGKQSVPHGNPVNVVAFRFSPRGEEGGGDRVPGADCFPI